MVKLAVGVPALVVQWPPAAPARPTARARGREGRRRRGNRGVPLRWRRRFGRRYSVAPIQLQQPSAVAVGEGHLGELGLGGGDQPVGVGQLRIDLGELFTDRDDCRPLPRRVHPAEVGLQGW